MYTFWQGECPACGAGFYGSEEASDEPLECPECKAKLLVSTELSWEVDVIQEEFDDEDA